MTNILATTPQLKVVKNLFDAYISLDIKNVKWYFSKNFTFQTFPKIPNLPDEEQGMYAERYGVTNSDLSQSNLKSDSRSS